MTRGKRELWQSPSSSPPLLLSALSPCLWPVVSTLRDVCRCGRKRLGAVVSWRGKSDRLRNTHASYRENLVPYVRDLKPSGFLYHIWNFTDPLKPCAGCSTPKSTSGWTNRRPRLVFVPCLEFSSKIWDRIYYLHIHTEILYFDFVMDNTNMLGFEVHVLYDHGKTAGHARTLSPLGSGVTIV